MDATDKLGTSTPLQCRQDSGYGRYPEQYGLLELSPIRKLSSDVQRAQNKVPEKVNPRKLSFFSLSNDNNSDSSESDSGIGSSINESVPETNNQTSKTQYFTDENCNFVYLDNATENKLYQPSKYICKDHSYKNVFCQCERNADASKIFRSFSISSDLFKSVKKPSKVDILYELSIRNCTSIISDILACLTDDDLRRVNNVSKIWQNILSSDKKANNRRILFINNKKNAACGPNKENNSKIESPVERDHKSAFTSLDNVVKDTKQPLALENTQGRYDSFIQELKTEKNHAIMKCPKCCYPARCTEFKYCCTRNLCRHEFCPKCLGPFLDNHKCAVLVMSYSLSSSIVVGSKKSRKNLRRLMS